MPILTKQVGKQFWPWTLANEKALAEGKEEFSVTLGDKVWTQKPQKYHARSLGMLRARYADVADKARSRPGSGGGGLPCRIARLDTDSRSIRGKRSWKYRNTRPP